jgi:hypothetical protein
MHQELEAGLGPDAMAYSMATDTLHSPTWTQTGSETPHSEVDDAILQALGKIPFASVNELARRLSCAPPTAYCHLTESLHLVSKHLQWVPHDATPAQEDFRVEESNMLLRFLKSI